MDSIDEQILSLLASNSRLPASAISKQINLSIPAVTERIRKLERSGIITGYTVRLNQAKLGSKLMAFILVTIDGAGAASAFRLQMANHAQIKECHHIAGEYDYLLKVIVADTSALENFITHTLKTIPGVARSNTMIVLSSND